VISVALVGADGAGKTTVARHLAETLPLPVTYLYMGINAEASNVALPTTRLFRRLRKSLGVAPDQGGPPDPSRSASRPRNPARRLLRGVKSSLGLANRIVEEWHRDRVARAHLRRGEVVLFDRHFYFDYYFHDVADTSEKRSLGSRIHGLLLERTVARPDLVLCLDAPAEVLFARKGEGTVELCEARRQEYLRMAPRFDRFVVIDATRPLEAVLAEVAERITEAYGARQAGSTGAAVAEPKVDRVERPPA
jgi:thymidylate kinase